MFIWKNAPRCMGAVFLRGCGWGEYGDCCLDLVVEITKSRICPRVLSTIVGLVNTESLMGSVICDKTGNLEARLCLYAVRCTCTVDGHKRLLKGALFWL